MKQQSLFDKTTKRRYARTEHGGSKSIGKRKLERPFAKGNWVHLVLKSSKAHGKYSLLSAKAQTYIESLVYKKAKQFGVSIGDYVNVGDHLHVKVRASSKILFQKFIKSITGLIARFVTKARRGHPFGKFWDALAYTRVLKSGRENIRLWNYFGANRTESVFGYRRRQEVLDGLNEWMRLDPMKQQNSRTFDEFLARECGFS